MSERSSPIVSRRANCRQHQAAGNVPSECLCDNKTSCIAVTANKGEPKGKPFISTASLTIHTCVSSRNRASYHCDSQRDSRRSLAHPEYCRHCDGQRESRDQKH